MPQRQTTSGCDPFSRPCCFTAVFTVEFGRPPNHRSRSAAASPTPSIAVRSPALYSRVPASVSLCLRTRPAKATERCRNAHSLRAQRLPCLVDCLPGHQSARAVLPGVARQPPPTIGELTKVRQGPVVPVGGRRKSTRPGANGVVELTPFEFPDRLADLVPPPRKHRHRYRGVFAPNHMLRRPVTALAIGNISKRREAATGEHAAKAHAAEGCYGLKSLARTTPRGLRGRN
jgi:hypothetical protein